MSEYIAKKLGFSLVEIVIALGVFAILAAGVFQVSTSSYDNFYGTGDKQSVTEFAEEAIEVVRIIRDNGWQEIEEVVDAEKGITKDGDGKWVFIGSGAQRSNNVLGDLTRIIEITDVERDASGSIVDSGGTEDPSTKKVVVTVSGTNMDDYVLDTYITNWSRRAWEQTDWAGLDDDQFWTDSAMASSSVTNISTSTAGQLVLTSTAFGNGYSYRRTISIESDNVDGSYSHVDFPVLISTTTSWLKTTANGGYVNNTNGYDIVFSTNTQGSSNLDHEIEKYDGDTGEIVMWVEVPSVSPDTDTDIYIFYGSSTIATSQEDITGTWNSDYKLVQHFNETANDQLDSTSNDNDGTFNGATGNPYITVQKGEAAFVSGNSTVDAELGTAVDPDYAFIMATFRGDDAGSAQDMERIYVTADFVDTDTIRFTRGETGNISNVSWQVIEADSAAPTPAFTVSTGTVAFGTLDTTKTDTIPALSDADQAIVITGLNSATGDDRPDMLVRGSLNSGTEVQLDRNGTGIAVNANYFVVEFSNDINVYKGSTTMTAASTANDSIGGTVNLAQSAIFMTFSCTNNGLAQSSPRAYLDTTTIYFDRTTATGNCTIEWAVVEFPSDVVVQSDNNSSSPATTGELLNTTITAVTLANTILTMSNKCSGTGTAFPRPVTTAYLSSTTNIEFRTNYSGQTNTWTYYAIDTSGWTYPTETGPGTNARIGKGDYFDDDDNKVTFSDTASLEPGTGDFTFSFWINPSSSGTTYSSPFFKGNGDVSVQDGWIFRHRADAGAGGAIDKIFFSMGDGSINLGQVWTNSALTDNVWTHVAMVIDRGTSYQYYINGSADNSCTTWPCYNSTSTVAGPALQLGEDWSDSYMFSGYMDEVRYYTTATSSDWISTEYNNQNATSTFYTIGSANGYDSGGELYSSIYDIGSSDQQLKSMIVEQDVPSGCTLIVTLEASDDKTFATSNSQVFTDYSTTYYTSSTPASLNGVRYLRYKVDMEPCGTDDANTPTLYSVKLNYR